MPHARADGQRNPHDRQPALEAGPSNQTQRQTPTSSRRLAFSHPVRHAGFDQMNLAQQPSRKLKAATQSCQPMLKRDNIVRDLDHVVQGRGWTRPPPRTTAVYRRSRRAQASKQEAIKPGPSRCLAFLPRCPPWQATQNPFLASRIGALARSAALPVRATARRDTRENPGIFALRPPANCQLAIPRMASPCQASCPAGNQNIDKLRGDT